MGTQRDVSGRLKGSCCWGFAHIPCLSWNFGDRSERIGTLVWRTPAPPPSLQKQRALLTTGDFSRSSAPNGRDPVLQRGSSRSNSLSNPQGFSTLNDGRTVWNGGLRAHRPWAAAEGCISLLSRYKQGTCSKSLKLRLDSWQISPESAPVRPKRTGNLLRSIRERRPREQRILHSRSATYVSPIIETAFNPGV